MTIKESESGFTLLEVVASLIIITIILMSFYSFFISTAKTTKTSNEIFNATYYAQKEMEHLYQLSQIEAFNDRISVITAIPNGEVEEREKYYYSGTTTIFEKLGDLETDPNNNYYYILKCIPEFNNVTTVIIEVYDEKSGLLKAKMENKIEWRASK